MRRKPGQNQLPFVQRLANQAEVQLLEGHHADALETVERALTVNPQERAFLPGTLRLRGDLRSTLGDTEGGELDYREAHAVARSMGAKAWELRAASSLTRCLHERGESRLARELLKPVLDSFSESPCSADFGEATDLMNRLGA